MLLRIYLVLGASKQVGDMAGRDEVDRACMGCLGWLWDREEKQSARDVSSDDVAAGESSPAGYAKYRSSGIRPI